MGLRQRILNGQGGLWPGVLIMGLLLIMPDTSAKIRRLREKILKLESKIEYQEKLLKFYEGKHEGNTK